MTIRLQKNFIYIITDKFLLLAKTCWLSYASPVKNRFGYKYKFWNEIFFAEKEDQKLKLMWLNVSLL